MLFVGCNSLAAIEDTGVVKKKKAKEVMAAMAKSSTEKAAKPDHTILIQLSLPTPGATDEANAAVTGVADISATATSQQ